MENCIFCKIANGEIPSTRVYENDYVFAINDLHPKAPRHILLIPKVHIEKFSDLDDKNLAKSLLETNEFIKKSTTEKERTALLGMLN